MSDNNGYTGYGNGQQNGAYDPNMNYGAPSQNPQGYQDPYGYGQGYQNQDYQNQGYCSERLEALIDFAFNTLGLHRIERQVMPRNEKSLAIMKKFNFVQEGLQRQCYEVNNKWEDHYQFAILNDKISAVQHYDD